MKSDIPDNKQDNLLEDLEDLTTTSSDQESTNEDLTAGASPGSIDLVITDQTMPNMSGTELATELIKIRPDIPIILCTGFSTKVSEEKIKEIGIRELIMKPLNIKQISAIIRKVLDGKFA